MMGLVSGRSSSDPVTGRPEVRPCSRYSRSCLKAYDCDVYNLAPDERDRSKRSVLAADFGSSCR